MQADELVHDGEAIHVGPLALTVWFTPGHPPGSMSWTWSDTLDGRPIRIAYADSPTAPGYRLVDNPAYPHIVDDFHRSAARVRALPCDLLLTPHPGQSGWDYADTVHPHPTRMSCAAYADDAEKAIDAQLAAQRREAAAGSVR